MIACRPEAPGFSRALGRLIVAVACGWTGCVGTGAEGPAGELPVTSYQQYLTLQEAGRTERLRLQFEAVVTYYDPDWKLLWGDSDGTPFFFQPEGRFPVASGQRVRIEGWAVPARGPVLEEAGIVPLGGQRRIEPINTHGRLADSKGLHQRVVVLEGRVEGQVRIDPTHLRIDVRAEGLHITGNILLNPDDPLPRLEGVKVRLRGVFVDPGQTEGKVAEPTVWVGGTGDVEVIGPPAADWKPTAPPREVSTSRPAADGDLPLITSITDFWTAMNGARSNPHRIQLDADVTFYDPWWNQLWGREERSHFYLEPGRDLPIRAGQRVRIEGTVVPVQGLKIQNPRLTVVGDAAPVEPLETRGLLDQRGQFHERVVWMEGYVEHQIDADSSHVQFDFVVGAHNVAGRILLEKENAPQPQLAGALIRVRGLFVDTTDPSGRTKKLSLGIARPGDVQVLGWLATDPRFDLPETAVIDLVGQPSLRPVHLRGTVHSITKGRSIVLRDSTGQVTLLTAQNRGLDTGMEIEVVGFPAGTGPSLALREALWRPARAATGQPVAAPSVPGLPKLRLIEQIMELPPVESDRGYPVLLQGEVVWANPRADFFFLLDSSRGVRVDWPGRLGAPPEPFRVVALSGVSATGPFAPVVTATTVTHKGMAAAPEARRVTLEQMMTGAEEGRWVEVQGFLRGIVADGAWARLEMTTAAGEFSALLPPSETAEGWVGAVLRLQGVCSATANERRQLTAVQLWVPSWEFVQIEEPAPTDPFAVPAGTIPSLRQFGQLQTINRRIKTHGVVLHHVPGRYALIQDGTEGLQVLSRSAAPLSPGDRIEVVGFPGREGNRVVLREALYRTTTLGSDPGAVSLEGLSPFDPELDGRLVTVEGSLVQMLAQERQVELTLKRGGVLFKAVLDSAPGTPPPEDWSPGCQLGITAVFRVQFDEYRRANGFHLQLRGPGDVRLLARPPWWTIGRALGAAGFLAVCSGLVVVWVAALRRRVSRQTAQIREQLEQRARLEAELQHATRIESLGVLAGGIAHDFNNLLTVVMGNITLAMLEERAMAVVGDCLSEAEQGARRARDLTQQLLTFAKGGSPVRSVVALPQIVRESAAFALHGAAARCEFDIAPDLWAAEVDKGQVGQVVHNLALNAVQAMPGGGVLRLTLANEQVARGASLPLAAGRYLRLAVSDSAEGIDPAVLPRIFEPYFSTKQQGSGLGLATVYSIVKRHQGHIEVTSEPGRGTTFRVWLPAALASLPAPSVSAGTSRPEWLAGRVLFMDDEATIRRLGTSALERIGIEVTAVADGAEAVREIAAAHGAGRPYSLVIFDLTVPGGMGGREAIGKVREIDPEVRAIVSSGYSNDPVMADHRAHGFDAMVPKPYEIHQLTDAVRQVLALGRRSSGR